MADSVAYADDPSDPSQVIVTAKAGKTMDSLAAETAALGLWGLENLSGIPGHVGAAAVQNVGAYGVEAADLIESVTYVDVTTGEVTTAKPDQLAYAYRDSVFKHSPIAGNVVIIEVSFRLSRRPAPRLGYAGLSDSVAVFRDSAAADEKDSPTIIRQAVIATRDAKLPNPAIVGSAGSFFKNPVVEPSVVEAISALVTEAKVPAYPQPDGRVKLSAAWLIDRSGLKGASVGSAKTWMTQPLVIVNSDGKATAADILALEKKIIDTVNQRFGVVLSPEVEHIPSPAK